METYVVYAKPDGSGYIAAVNSSAFLLDTEGWVEIDQGHGDKYHHAQGNYFDKPIRTESGVYRYKLADGSPVECTQEEIAEQEAALPKPGPSTTLEARVEALEQAFEISILAMDTAYTEGVNSL